MAPASRIARLSATIASNTAVVDSYLASNDLPTPSFSPHQQSTGHAYPPAIEAARAAVEEATLELHDLIRGPRSIIMDGPNQWAARAFIAKFDIAALVPADGSISYADLAAKTGTGIAPSALQTLCRLAIAHRIFSEPEPGRIAHSAASKMLHDEAVMRKFFSANADFFPLVASVTATLKRFPAADDPLYTAAAVSEGTVGHKGFYDHLSEQPQRAEDFHAAMKLFSMAPGLSSQHVLDVYDWAALPPGSLCIDLGGGEGEYAITLARAHSHLLWEVQDLANAFVNLRPLPDEVGGRVTFRAHDFFTPQPHTARDPAIFFFRWILHNHSDAQCQRILRALVPSLERNPTAKIIFMDNVLPPMNVLPNTAERAIRSMDVTMLELGNGRERDEGAWREMITAADDRFVVERCGMFSSSSRLGAVVIGWQR